MNNPAKGHSIWQFLLKRLVIIIVVVLLCMLAFHTGKRITNCTVMADEAMTARINYAFSLNNMQEDTSLKRYFTSRMIGTGDLQNLKSRYSNFSISGFNETGSVKWVWSWPGSDTAHVHVTERVPTISGEAKNSDDIPDISIPKWEDGIYDVTLKRTNITINGTDSLVWLVDDIMRIADAPTPTPWPTDTPAISGGGSPTATPTPTPTAGPTPTPEVE